MPIYNRQGLRQTLGQNFLGDTILAHTHITLNAPVGGGAFDNGGINADPTLSGQNLYENTYIYHQQHDYRVASFNTASGAWVTGQTIQATVSYLDAVEIHQRLKGSDKDLALDDTLKRLRVRQEVGMMVATDNMQFFQIDNAASPHTIVNVLDAYYFANPFGSLDRDQRRFQDLEIVTTASQTRELRIFSGIAGSQQIILDAVLELTLAAGDTSTVTLPDDRWLLAGAAARCYDLQIQLAPGQNVGELRNRRAEWAAEFTRLSGRFAPNYASKIRLGETDHGFTWPLNP